MLRCSLLKHALWTNKSNYMSDNFNCLLSQFHFKAGLFVVGKLLRLNVLVSVPSSSTSHVAVVNNDNVKISEVAAGMYLLTCSWS